MTESWSREGNSSEMFERLVRAQKHFRLEEFNRAIALCREYGALVRYDDLHHHDYRGRKNGVAVSFIVVTLHVSESLRKCVESLQGESNSAEILVVVNDRSDRIAQLAESLGIFATQTGVNILPGEARNIGAHFARGKYLAFIDDDARVCPRYAENVVRAFQDFNFSAVRGRIVPKSGSRGSDYIGHYDRGRFPLPSLIDTEGNAIIPADVFTQVGGFDPLVFGGEGVELSARILQAFPEREIYYWPTICIKHDYAKGSRILEKRARQLRTVRFLEFDGRPTVSLERRYAEWQASHPHLSRQIDSRSLLVRALAFGRDVLIRIRILARRFYERRSSR